ncbi:Yox1 protein [Starmerella bacillaris]|uniref:Yox1 protein n=1 Tax=Starmerella bacillaris TaxID=1247836 RepID=A0AAV5RH32_STABA|nr:Yox1 protein [Starmerella bacillaris]
MSTISSHRPMSSIFENESAYQDPPTRTNSVASVDSVDSGSVSSSNSNSVTSLDSVMSTYSNSKESIDAGNMKESLENQNQNQNQNQTQTKTQNQNQDQTPTQANINSSSVIENTEDRQDLLQPKNLEKQHQVSSLPKDSRTSSESSDSDQPNSKQTNQDNPDSKESRRAIGDSTPVRPLEQSSPVNSQESRKYTSPKLERSESPSFGANDSGSDANKSNTSTLSSSPDHSDRLEENSKPSDIKEYPRKRRRTSPNELYILESEFSKNAKPCREVRERIAKLTSMDEKAVQVWFQNKRQSCRRHMNQYQKPSQCENLFKGVAFRTKSMPVMQDENNPFVIAPITAHASHSAHIVQAQAQAHANANAHAHAQTSSQVHGHTHVPNTLPAGSGSNLGQASLKMSTSIPNAHAQGSMHYLDVQSLNLGPPSDHHFENARRTKSLKLSMSADGKAEIVERSPLKPLKYNQQSNKPQQPAMKSSSSASSLSNGPSMAHYMPSLASQLNGVETECANSLLVLKSGQWR